MKGQMSVLQQLELLSPQDPPQKLAHQNLQDFRSSQDTPEDLTHQNLRISYPPVLRENAWKTAGNI